MDSDPLLEGKQIAIERVQSSEFNRLPYGQSIGCNGLVLNRMVWSPYLGRLATVSMTLGDRFVRRAKTSMVTSIFSFSVPKEMYQEGSGAFWKNFKVHFFAATVWFSEPLDLQLKHIPRPAKNWSFRPQLLTKRTRWPQFFLMSEVVMKRMTDTEKISQFLGRIRTGSSYLNSYLQSRVSRKSHRP